MSALAPLRRDLGKAVERALDLSFDDYQSQVVAYLAPDQVDALGTRGAWDAIQTQVVEAIERAKESKP